MLSLRFRAAKMLSVVRDDQKVVYFLVPAVEVEVEVGAGPTYTVESLSWLFASNMVTAFQNLISVHLLFIRAIGRRLTETRT